MNTRPFLPFFLFLTLLIPQGTAKADDVINLLVGDIESVAVNGLTRVSVTNPEVADISDAQSDKVIVLAKKSGQTALFLWDADGKKTLSVRVVSQDLSALKARISNLLQEARITSLTLDANAPEGRVVIAGQYPKDKKDVLDKILDPYAEQVINLSNEETSDDLIQIDMQITELTTTLSKNIGLDWNKSGTLTGGATTSNNFLNLDYKETLPATDGSIGDFFKIGDFNRTSAIMATVNALIEEGKGRILSKPRLVVVSGKEASFLVGGEIPIRTTSSNASGGATENVEFKQYGINMTITPTIRNGKIDVLLKTQISDIDRANKVGDDVAFVTRDAQTQLYLDNGQTIVLAGLIKHTDGESVRGVPFLSKIPVLGAVFRNKSTPTANTDTEMVIALTPRILSERKYATEEPVFNSPRQRSYQKAVESRFEKTQLDKGSVVTNEIEESKPAPAAVDKEMDAQEPKAVAPAALENAISVTKTAPVDDDSDKEVSGDVTAYVRAVQVKISQAISYPYEALQNNLEGTVKLKLRILKDGSLAEAMVLESSGQSLFDTDALNTAKISAPYAPFSDDMKGGNLVVTIPIVYARNAKPATETVVPAY